MESLIKQMRGRSSGVPQASRDNPGRVRFSGIEQETVETDGTRDRRIPPQKTQFFKGDKKKGWFSRQFSGQMNQEYNYSDSGEYPIAVAAAAYAIKAIEDSGIEAQKRTNAGSRTSTNIRSKPEDKATKVSEPLTESKKASDDVPDKRVLISAATNVNLPQKITAPVPSFQRSPKTADERFNSIAAGESKIAAEKRTDVSAPRMKKNSTFADKNINSTGTAKHDTTFPRTSYPSTKPATLPHANIRTQTSTKPGMGNTKADVWEKAEMAKIIERYEKLNSTIIEWENKKKTTAKRKMDKIEIELDKKRAKAMQHYRTKIAMIDQIAGGARTKAEENRRHEEVQVKEKANKIRSTGKYPSTCLCF